MASTTSGEASEKPGSWIAVDVEDVVEEDFTSSTGAL